jgi:deoxyribonuclease-4
VLDNPAGSGRPIGAHVPVSGGLATGGLRYAAAVGADAIQVFVSNPRGWALAAGDQRQDAALREHVALTGLPVFVHAPYLLNVASPDPLVRERSAESLRFSLLRGGEIGARGVVVHTGSAIAGDRADALRRVRDCLLPVLAEIRDDGPDLLLEPMAGQGQMLCGMVADLEPYLDALDWHPRANVCLDTCHVFAAGHDLTARHGVSRMLRALQTACRDPSGRLRLIHANDSKGGCGSRRDLHENIGHGQIGRPAFASLLRHPVTAGVPFIVETPGGESGQAKDTAALRELRDAVTPAARPRRRPPVAKSGQDLRDRRPAVSNAQPRGPASRPANQRGSAGPVPGR